ncbi:MAG: DUF3604 domain-containing protein [Blastomonas sp.]
MPDRKPPMLRGSFAGMAMIASAVLAGCGNGSADRTAQTMAETARPDSSGTGEKRVWFGDLHVHTSYSLDAAVSKTDTLPADAYRFAMGEPVRYFGKDYRIGRPLDFLAVTDHAEYLGVVRAARDPDGPYADTPWPGRLGSSLADDIVATFRRISLAGFRNEKPIPEFANPAIIRDSWQNTIAAAQRYYRPGAFTTFVAFEWSAMPGGGHIHRNVIFRGPDYPDGPFASTDSPHPEKLWEYADANRGRGMDSLMIPHNSNLSDGLMFNMKDSWGNDMTQAYARSRQRNEVAVEITQTKGTSETTPQLSPDDEFAGFELLRTRTSVDNGSYVRQGLGRGMAARAKLGINPYKLGIIGASDTHSGLAASEEDNLLLGGLNYALGLGEPEVLATRVSPITGASATVMSASGLTGVWAEENSREAIFDALRRKEVFGTSGTRMRARLFGGWNYSRSMLGMADWIAKAYRMGVPMGGDLPLNRAANGAPGFLAWAQKDPDGANLDRVQIVKLWLGPDGQPRERIVNVAWSGNRELSPDNGTLPPVGNTVDTERATYSNSIGAPELLGYWQDPEFDPASPAIYYVRVLEIPTPRWPVYLAVRNGFTLPPDIPRWIQERAWTSPIFYEP